MIKPDKIFGRLGNRMFQMAFLYAETKDKGLDWYLQDEKYFERYKDDIRNLYGQGIKEEIDMIAIHVRRTDYVGNSFYTPLWKTDYYERAMELFPKENFLIFSDDPHWCEEHFKANNMEICYEDDEIKSLNIMASCKGIIIANSSFSWWGAYLGNPNKKVVAPKSWYSDGVERTVCPSNWIRI